MQVFFSDAQRPFTGIVEGSFEQCLTTERRFR
jgi:hypothetical protein